MLTLTTGVQAQGVGRRGRKSSSIEPPRPLARLTPPGFPSKATDHQRSHRHIRYRAELTKGVIFRGLLA